MLIFYPEDNCGLSLIRRWISRRSAPCV